MNSALYFPLTTIRSPSLLREALLLWDRVETIVPWEGFQPADDLPKPYIRAQELLVAPRVPTCEEQLAVHHNVAALIERGLSEWLVDTPNDPGSVDLTGSYGIYGKKLLPETWKLLEDAALAQVRASGRQDYDVPRGVGLLLLASLADECAGQQHQLITDHHAAYSCIMRWLSARLGGSPLSAVDATRTDSARQRLVSACVSQVATDGIPIERLVALREDEVRRPGSGLFEFRANYRKRLDQCLDTLSSQAKHDGDYEEILRSFEQSMASDLANLKTELGLEKAKLLFNRDLVIGLVLAAGVIVPALPPALQIPAVGAAGIAAVAKGFVDYLSARRKTLFGRAMSWLYLAHNG
jgi:hypothetical protein